MYHVHYQIGNNFGDLYVAARSWSEARRRALRRFNASDRRWVSFSC
jgi:hypothetical protein